MTADRRRQEIRTLPDGSLVDEAAMRAYLESLVTRPARVGRLSQSDPAHRSPGR